MSTKLGHPHTSGLFDKSEENFYDFLSSESGCAQLAKAYSLALGSAQTGIDEIEPSYAADYADRLLHDRQLCAHVAQVLVVIGFDGDDDDTGVPREWCGRIPVPNWARDALVARDRGKCANCGADLSLELEAPINIDHMVPLSKGGCNDIVNLQILCNQCNSHKRDDAVPILSSVPRYFVSMDRRAKKRR